MGLLDGLLGRIAENIDVQNLAAKVGISPDQVEQAVTPLAQAQPRPVDTVGHIGGEGALGRVAGLLGEQGEAMGKLGAAGWRRDCLVSRTDRLVLVGDHVDRLDQQNA